MKNNDPKLKSWARDQTKEIADSKIFLQLYNPMMSDSQKSLLEPELLLQLGYAMMLDKPIIMLADYNDTLPSRLKKVASVVWFDRSNPDSLEQASEKVAQIVDEITNNEK